MNVFVLYFVLLEATVTTFAGLGSLPIVRDELVVQRAVITDVQLNQAVVISRVTPGPVGGYVVSVGYFAAGIPGAIAGWLAMATPALLVLPLLHLMGRKTEHPRVKAVLRAVVLTSAGLLLAALVPLAQAAITSPPTLLIALVTIGVMLKSRIDTLWIILGAALVASAIGAVSLSIGS